MASKQQDKKTLLGNLYAQISRLKKQIDDMEEHHRVKLNKWTKQCGQMGNEIGYLRQQLRTQECDLRTEHEAELSVWTKKCGTMGNEIIQLRKQIADKEHDLNEKHQAALYLWIKKCGEVTAEIARLRKELLKNETEYQSEREHSKQEIDVLRQRCEKLEIEHQTDILKQRIESDLTKLIDRQSNEDDENLCGQCHSGQINDIEADRIVKTYCSSEGETDETNRANESVEKADVSGSITEDDSFPIASNHQLQPDETVKQKPKFVFWNTLKKHVSMKSKLAKSSTLTYKVTDTD